MNINNFNTWAKQHILDETKFDKDGFIIMENNSNFKSTGIISKIFEDHWDSFYSKYKMVIDTKRPNASKEIDKIINCSNHNLGASVFVCPNDEEVYFCHHTCRGKLCSSCGIKSQKIKTQNILEKCINTKHRHITFTIPNDLVLYFFDDLTSNNLLFDSVCETIYSVVNGKVKKSINLNLCLVSLLSFILLVDLLILILIFMLLLLNLALLIMMVILLLSFILIILMNNIMKLLNPPSLLFLNY